MEETEQNKDSEQPAPAPVYPTRFLIVVVILSLLSGYVGGLWGVGGRNSDINKPTNTTKQVVVSEESAVIDVVKRASPAVVSIVISKDMSKLQQLGTSPFDNDFFSQFFGSGRTPQRQTEPVTPNVQKIGAGSGFLVTSDGTVLTNKHVVSDEQASYTVLTNDGKSYEAKVLTRDPVNDLAILKIDIKDAPVLKLSTDSTPQIGQKVIAIGNSLGQYDNTVTTGVVSGIGRSIMAGGNGASEQLDGVIQTDAAINPGNSGGPLLNISGEVIGINTAIDEQGQLVGFAIPAVDASRALSSYQKNGKIVRVYVGVRYVMINGSLAKAEKLPVEYGALVSRGEATTDLAVIPGSPADKAGLVENDIVLECEGKKIADKVTLSSCIKDKQVGDVISLKIYHRGEEKIVKVKLEESK